MYLLFRWLVILLIVMASHTSAKTLTDYAVGFSELNIDSETRPLNGHLWYPAEPIGKEELAGGNLVWEGFLGIKDAPPNCRPVPPAFAFPW